MFLSFWVNRWSNVSRKKGVSFKTKTDDLQVGVKHECLIIDRIAESQIGPSSPFSVFCLQNRNQNGRSERGDQQPDNPDMTFDLNAVLNKKKFDTGEREIFSKTVLQ